MLNTNFKENNATYMMAMWRHFFIDLKYLHLLQIHLIQIQN